MQLLKDNPNKRVEIYGNGGRDDAAELTEEEINYHYIPKTKPEFTIITPSEPIIDDPFGDLFEEEIEMVKVPFYFGSGTRVYQQKVYGLSNDDAYHIQRIKEENRRLLTESDVIKVGDILLDRAKMVKRFLVKRGINARRIEPKRGEFTPTPNSLVRIKVLH